MSGEEEEDEQGGEEEESNEGYKLVAVGDGTVGKSFATNKFPSDYIPTVFDSNQTEMFHRGKVRVLGLWDTAGQTDFDRIRNLSYNNCDIFLVCFSLVSPTSLEHVETKWLPEIKHYEEAARYVLVGTKSDLERTVTEEDGRAMAKKVKARGYIECSAKTQTNLKEVFELCVDIILKDDGELEDEKGEGGSGGGDNGGCCIIL